MPGPHTASVLQVGRSITMNLTPLGSSHPPLNTIGLTSSITRCAGEPGRKVGGMARSSGCSIPHADVRCCQSRGGFSGWRAHTTAPSTGSSAGVSCGHCIVCCWVVCCRWFAWYPAAGAALITGCYALLAGCALIVAPKTVLGKAHVDTASPTGKAAAQLQANPAC